MDKNRFKRCSLLMLILVFCGISSFAQTLTGKVTDTKNEPLPGVTVMLKGASAIGTITDIDGVYNLKINDAANDVIIATFIGMESQEIAVKGRSTINIVMMDSYTQLDEVVAVGYGTVKKRDITGSVASVKGDDLKAVPVSDAVQAMQGKMAGVQISATEGSPDAEMSIKVRGGGSITQDNSPLFIVDGFPVSSLSDIPASDIESIDVLKDASSTAIYGSRGANGVIIVTTKSGKEGKTSVSYNAYYGIKNIAKKLDVLDVNDYVNWQYEYAVLDNDIDDIDSYTDYFGNYQDIDLYEGMKGNNWQEQIYGRTGEVFSHDISVRGGSEKMNYAFNYANYSEKAIMIGSDFQRQNAALKLNHKPNDKVKLALSARYSDTEVSGGGANEQNEVSAADSRLKHAVTYSPIPLNGLTTDDADEDISNYLINPITATRDNDQEKFTKKLNLSASFSWDITDNLTFKSDVGYDYYNFLDHRFYGLTTYYIKNKPSADYQNMPAVRLIDQKTEKFRNTNTFSYDFKKIIGGKHSLKVLVGQEIFETSNNKLTTYIHGFPEDFTSNQAFKLTTQGEEVLYVDNNYSPDDRLYSFFGRANYDFDSKYLISATFRADGSSKFGDGNKWGYFPSIAGAWRISQENFMQNFKGWLDDMKIRLSYGTAGNNNIPTGQIDRVYSSSATTWINDVSSYWYTKTLANPDLKWETTYTRNAGVDFAMFRSRLNGNVELYWNTTKDLLIEFPISGTGYSSQYRNMGETENKGIELSVNWVALDKSNFGLNVGFNVSMNRNEIMSLGIMDDFSESSGWASTDIGDDFIIRKGGSVGEMYGYRADGRYEVSDFSGYDEANDKWILNEGVADASGVIGELRPGMMKLKDLDGLGEIDSDDREIIGNANPKATGGFTINARVYNFDIGAVFNWSYGNDVYNANKIEYTTGTQRYQYRNLTTDMASGKRWTNIDESGNLVNDPVQLEAMNANTTMWSPYMGKYVFSDWAVEDGSFVRLSTATIGYTLPKSITSKIKVQNLRFYVTGYNLFLLTDYTGFDPEASTRRNTPLTPGVDYSAYPRSSQFVFGLNLNF